MKKLLLATLVLLWTFDASGQILSQFTWEPGAGPTGHHVADIGPNAVSSGTNSRKTTFGNGSPNGLAPGSSLNPIFCCTSFCPTHSSCTTPIGNDVDFVVPEGTPGYFDRGSMTWQIDFNRRNNEIAANFFDRGNSLRFGSDCCGIVYIHYRVTQPLAPFFRDIGTSTGQPGFTGSSPGQTFSNTGNSNEWFTHSFIYDSISGIGEVWRNDFATPRWSSTTIGEVHPGQGLYWGGAPPSYTIGLRTDAMATDCTAFDNATVSTPVILPAKLGYFKGKNIGYEAYLEWETQSETNNAYFQIERYEPEDDEIVVVGRVDGSGTRNEPMEYSIIDRNPHAGTNIYIIRQFDENGSQRPMGSVEVYFEGFGNRVLEVYPNPVKEGAFFQVRFESNEEKAIPMSIVDINGRVVKRFTRNVYAGVNTIDFSTDGLSAGMYFFKANIGSKRATEKFVVAK